MENENSSKKSVYKYNPETDEFEKVLVDTKSDHILEITLKDPVF